ncbi:MAG: VWA domain-containing protein [Gammaproteobacteria bacterium]|nr:VWA domain-containing protein [Gammaproteobacteria bacterium]
MDLAEFHFLRPVWFLALIPMAIMLWLLIRRRLDRHSWGSLCDPQLLPYILIDRPTNRQPWMLYTLASCTIAGITALAGPTWERQPQPVYRNQSALVIALDLSRSMDATDLSPSRLVRARFKIADILNQRQDGQTALLAYAGQAFVVTPLTDDTATIASQLPALTTDLMPTQGSRLDLALTKAGELLKQSGFQRGDVLLISDALPEARDSAAAQRLVEQGYRLSVLGIGTPEGAPIPLPTGGFLKDRQGAIVVPKFNNEALMDMARRGGGIYVELRADDQDTLALLAQYRIDRLLTRVDETGQTTERWEEKGPWLLLLVLPLTALAFRRGYLVMLMLLLLPPPQSAQALDWTDLWLRADQQASRALQDGDAEKAANLFNHPGWKSTAWYRSKRYEQALQSLQGLDDSESLYNQGNALARLGRYPEAIKTYQQALEQNPDHQDAEYNRDLIQKLLDKQQPEQQEKQSDSDQQNPEQENQQQEQSSQQQDQQQSLDQEQQSDAPPQGSIQDARPQESQQEQAQAPTPEQTQEPEAAPPESAAEPKMQTEKPMDTLDESQQATEQWLRRIPDDPGGLLRRKFQYLYQQRSRPNDRESQPW